MKPVTRKSAAAPEKEHDMHTYGSALALIGVTVPDHLQAGADVPVLTAPQAQGDLLVVPASPPEAVVWQSLPAEGEQVVHGEATGNTHWLHGGFDSPGVRWSRSGISGAPEMADALIVGYLEVPDGQTAMLVHTDEHGANGIGAGTYEIRRKREFVRRGPDSGAPRRRGAIGRRPETSAWDLVWD